MKISRRMFLGSAIGGAVSATVLTGVKSTQATTQQFSGILYTKDNPGKWTEKAGSHAPLISVDGRKVTVTTPHPMSQDHYIVRHTLVLKDGTVAGEQTFFPVKDTKAVSTFELPEGYKSSFYATSFCNLHDLWVTEG